MTKLVITGISNMFPQEMGCFKEVQVNQRILIPPSLSDIKKLIQVDAHIELLNQYLVKTPAGTAFDGLALTGSQLSIKGCVRLNIKYLNHTPLQTMEYFNLTLPFFTYIALSPLARPEHTISPYIEDIFVKQLSSRQFYLSILFLLHLNS